MRPCSPGGPAELLARQALTHEAQRVRPEVVHQHEREQQVGMRLQRSARRSYFRCMKYITPSAASMSASPSRQGSSVPAGRRSYVRNTSSATMRIKPIQTTTYTFMVGPRRGAIAVMAPQWVFIR